MTRVNGEDGVKNTRTMCLARKNAMNALDWLEGERKGNGIRISLDASVTLCVLLSSRVERVAKWPNNWMQCKQYRKFEYDAFNAVLGRFFCSQSSIFLIDR